MNLLQEEEGWWEGTVNGKMGMFPSNFVEVEDETPQEKTAGTSLLSSSHHIETLETRQT